jgi:SAM-dependent methyltransferase
MHKNIDLNPSYVGPRDDVLSLIPSHINTVLDIGCSTGTLGEDIKNKYNAEVTGIEVDEISAQLAENKIDRVILGNIENLNLVDHISYGYFDCIIFADILEHLINPWKVLSEILPFLSKKGVVIASIPNIRHYSTFVSLIFDKKWPYNERGIHEINHLRYFTYRNIMDLFQFSGFEIIKVNRNYRIIEKPNAYNRFSKYFSVFPLKDFITFQFLVVAKLTTNN